MSQIDINEFRLWTKTKNPINSCFFRSIDKNILKIKNQTNLLYDEDNYTKKGTIRKNSKINGNFNPHLHNPETFSSMRRTLIEMNKKINKIKKSTQNICQTNELYLEKLRTTKFEDKQSECETLETIQQVTGDKKIFVPVGIVPYKKKNFTRNFSYINNNFRKQLSKAFFKFNPIIHLSNLQMMSQIDSSIKNDIEELTKTINKDIETISDKRYYSKRYETIKKKNNKERKIILELSNDKSPRKELINNQSTPFLRRDHYKRSTIMNRRQTVILSKLNLPYELRKKSVTLQERKLKESKFYFIINNYI